MRITKQVIHTKSALLAMLLIACSGSAWAYSSMNVRPVGVSGSGLQDELNQLFGCSTCVNATTDQSPVGMWHTSTSQYPVATAVLQFSSPLVTGDTFGIWTNPNQPEPIMSGSASGGSTAFLMWNSAGNLSIASNNCGPVNCTNTPLSDIWSGAFGFYLQTPNGTYYTVDSLNPQGSAQALTYNYNNEWVLAFNGAPVTGSSASYSDFVVGIQSISGLPEPSSVILLGTSLPILAFIRWRRVSRARKA